MLSITSGPFYVIDWAISNCETLDLTSIVRPGRKFECDSSWIRKNELWVVGNTRMLSLRSYINTWHLAMSFLVCCEQLRLDGRHYRIVNSGGDKKNS